MNFLVYNFICYFRIKAVSEVYKNEDDFSAQEKAAVESTWVQKENEDRRRTESSGRETRQRKKEIKRLVYRAIC